MTNKTILMTSIIAMTVIFGITANYAFAADIKVQPVTVVINSNGEFHAWQITGADAESVLLVTLCDPSETFNPVLFVNSPSIFKFSIDDFGCGFPLESEVTYDPGQVENGCWVTQSRSLNFLGGQYTLTLDLQGSGAITPLGTVNSLVDCPDVIDFNIDIKPGSAPNSINTKSMGVVPVAILGSTSFDVLDVDVTTLAFGPAGAAPVHDLTNPDTFDDHLQDVNGDGFDDLVSHYKQKETGIVCGDTEAPLIVSTTGGEFILGTDSVNPKGCKD